MEIEKLSNNNVRIVSDLIWEFQQDHYRKYGDYYRLRNNSKEKIPSILLSLINKRNTKVLIGFNNNTPIGYIFLRIDKNIPIYQVEKYGYISGMYIVPKFRNQGFAKQLIEEAIKWFKQKDVDRIELKVNIDNDRGMRLWKAAGFKKQQFLMIKNIK